MILLHTALRHWMRPVPTVEFDRQINMQKREFKNGVKTLSYHAIFAGLFAILKPRLPVKDLGILKKG